MKYFFALAFFATAVQAAPVDVCYPTEGPKHFLSQWTEDSRTTDMISRVAGDEFSVEEGKVVYNEDLNGDGIKDYIFLSYSSAGSSGDFTYNFFIQCRGFLRNVGGDYFADVEVLSTHPESSLYKDIKIFSYNRDKQDQIMHRDGKPLITPHVWRFNPETKLYEGESR
ncbi:MULTISPECIES: hypothetical protein [unclassified Pseudomonas]|uniref:hypothetical protein n=1 Tax=unclassified Pseudomonas TaxID=196821 RepID=UPI002A3599D8|nr:MULTISPECIES: hypothetical protein [unclassified Pseudomonas]MDX9671819.1 hypothetical protein [Pseudomonas sp. P8_250]WPN34213.1 hypothetical protein QMK53_18640 [Pseudomonas sp. P8_139]WPN43988.1 hypothetical protein QMK55_12735 [Pseudomonas sp. P8_229]